MVSLPGWPPFGRSHAHALGQRGNLLSRRALLFLYVLEWRRSARNRGLTSPRRTLSTTVQETTMPSKARLSPLAGGQGNYRGAAEKDGPSAGWRMEHGWDGARGRTEQAYRNGTGREKERKRKGSGGGGGRPTVKARRKGGGRRISTQQKRRSPVCLCGVSCAFACRRPPLLGKTSKEGRTQRRTR